MSCCGLGTQMSMALRSVGACLAARRDKQGVSLAVHSVLVASRLGDIELQVAGLLHDAVEEGCITVAQLNNAGFSRRVVDVVLAVSRRCGEKYDDYVDRVICAGPDAVAVKLADLAENLREDRPILSESLRNRYLKAQEKLRRSIT
ncbi:(p)ppgpp synthetase [Caudoviricetes sp.]|nr:(p)ppgpp synthetase [Caudoviricetes sp.]UOF82725.1 (p)ppgpp synthetase [Caudoviricetes sp.]